jgi:topoisomerase-like DNA binding C4 zinc finger protein
LEIEAIISEIRNTLAHNLSEEHVYRLTQAWLVILRDAYHCDKKRFADDQIDFLKQVRTAVVHLRRFIDLQEELEGAIGLDEYNEALQELRLLDSKLADTAISRRVKKEIRQLIERRSEVISYEQSRRNTRVTNVLLRLEEKAGSCPNGKNHRLQIRQGKNGYFWGCSAFPSCWYTRPLSRDELAQLETT